MRSLALLFLGMAILLGCEDRDLSSLSEAARLEARQQVEAENQNRDDRVREMETELANRHRFYQGVKGVYEGSFQTDSGRFNVRLTILPSVPPYLSKRVRTPEEAGFDLSNLHFKIQVIQWNPANPASAVGCRAEDIHPDLATGEISIASENCPNVYLLNLADLTAAKKERSELAPDALVAGSADVASSLLDGKLAQVEALVGRIQPTTHAAVYAFSAQRVKR